MAPSRLVDDFRLELRVAPPEQPEEEAIRDFVAWLDQIQITDAAGFFPTIEQFVNALRAALIATASPLDPGALLSYRVSAHRHPYSLRAASATIYAPPSASGPLEIRPMFHASSRSCSCTASPATQPTDECLLLAEVEVPIVNAGPGQNFVEWTTEHDLVIDEQRRPILLSTRVLQEWMQSGLRGGK